MPIRFRAWARTAPTLLASTRRFGEGPAHCARSASRREQWPARRCGGRASFFLRQAQDERTKGTRPPSSPRRPFNQRQRRLRVRIDHPQQRPRRGVGGAAVLFPIAHGGNGDAQLVGSVGPTARLRLGLAEPGLGADRRCRLRFQAFTAASRAPALAASRSWPAAPVPGRSACAAHAPN